MSYQLQILLVTTISLASISLALGSFVSLLTNRIPNQEPIVFTKSKCPICRFSLKAINLIPIFSWLIQGGKCSNCKAKISVRYPLIELSSFLLAVLIIPICKDKSIAVIALYLAIETILLSMIVIDLENYFIPNSLQYALAICASFLLVATTHQSWLWHFSSAFLYLGFFVGLGFLFRAMSNVDAIGVDDLKFVFIAGFALGLPNLLEFMILIGMIGCLFGMAWILIKKDDCFPFAPAICLAFWLCLLYGDKVEPVKILDRILF